MKRRCEVGVRRLAWGLLLLLPAVLSIGCDRESASSGSDMDHDAVTCDQLVSFSAPGLTIDSAEELLSPPPRTHPYSGRPLPPLPPHCKVSGTIDAEIHFELLLPPKDAWNGRFAMGGGGGFVGSVQNELLMTDLNPVTVLGAGYATVGTDTGHQGSVIDASWALDNEAREINFAGRAVHVVADVSKAITEQHYGRGIDYSYFMGCSRGGGQAMIASQRYPDDFDGIVAGAPAYSWPSLGAGFLQIQKALYPDPARLETPVVTPANRTLLEREILERCDARDGVEDGVLTDPRDCDFSPESLPRCDAEPGPECLTEAQLHAIQTIYRGPEVDGEPVFPGFPFGGENDGGGWDLWITGGAEFMQEGSPNLHFAFGTQMYKYLVFDDPEFDYASYDFADWQRDTAASDELLSAKDTSLAAFRDRGGKIVFWHGWSDPALTALGTIEYYEAMRRDTEGADDFSRLYMLPGVLHCSGGPGADHVDWLALVADWVEQGEAPTRVVASHVEADGTAAFTRALCPYPQVARYDGAGDPKSASSYACAD